MEIIEIIKAYKTLKGYLTKQGITSENIEPFAKCYRYWKTEQDNRFPCEGIRIIYRHNGKSISLPFLENSLKNYCLGYQIENLCIVISHTKRITLEQIDDFLKETSTRLNRTIRLLTPEEVNMFRLTFYDETPKGPVYDPDKKSPYNTEFHEGISLFYNYLNEVGETFSPGKGLWWAKDSTGIKKIVADHEYLQIPGYKRPLPDFQYNPQILKNWIDKMEYALAFPVFAVDSDVVSGKLDENGIPTAETMEIINWFK